jgi:endoglucanase
MKKTLPLLLLLSFGLWTVAAPAATPEDEPLSPAEQVRQMGRGVNIVGYDPLWQDPSKARFKARHFKIIKDGGFSNVRINLHGFRQIDESGVVDPKWFETLDALVSAALEQDLHVILDEHDYELCSKDAAGCRTKLMAFWTQVAEHYKGASNKVMFEILNEPSRAMDAAWNKLHAEALGIIRKTNPSRNVLIGPAFWNNIRWLGKLELPTNDRHIIVEIHYYEPHEFTHQGASWAPEYAKLSGIRWGAPKDLAKIEKDFDTADAWSKKHDRPIYLGEFGAYDKAPLEDRIKYTAAVARAAEKRGWAWGYWQFDGNFIVYDIDKDEWYKPIHEALVPPQ